MREKNGFSFELATKFDLKNYLPQTSKNCVKLVKRRRPTDIFFHRPFTSHIQYT